MKMTFNESEILEMVIDDYWKINVGVQWPIYQAFKAVFATNGQFFTENEEIKSAS